VDELSGLTPEQRRLVLEYFRRLNETSLKVAFLLLIAAPSLARAKP